MQRAREIVAFNLITLFQRRPTQVLSQKRWLQYNIKQYKKDNDPSPWFCNSDVQSYLKVLTRMNLNYIYRRKRLGGKALESLVYKFMTDDELQSVLLEMKDKAEEQLQMCPVVPVWESSNEVLNFDPALQGIETSNIVITDITFGVRDSDRLIVVREPDGKLIEANLEVRNRMNQIFFPKFNRQVKAPRIFENDNLIDLLHRKEYEFVLDCSCAQFEPYDPKYCLVTNIVYDWVNDKNDFEKLRSTRHFGPFVFFLAWHKNIDNLLLELIETCHIKEANILIHLYQKLHSLEFKNEDNVDDLYIVKKYVEEYSNKKGTLELAIQSFEGTKTQNLELQL